MNPPSPAFRAATIDDMTSVIALLCNAGLPAAGVVELFAQDASQFLLATATGDV